jgi:hypothetical protein
VVFSSRQPREGISYIGKYFLKVICRVAEESVMAQLSLSEINCVRALSPRFELTQPFAGAYRSRSSGAAIDSAHTRVRGDLVRVAIASVKTLGLLLFAIVSLFSVLIFLLWSCAPPSDETLRRQFESHRSELDALIRMSLADADGIAITDNLGKLESNLGWAKAKSKRGITREKWNEYRHLFHAVHLSGLVKDKLGNVYLVAAAEFAARGTTKGFVHCASFGARDQTFLPCVEQRDIGQQQEAGDKGYSYRKLGQNWYIFEAWDKAFRR